METEVLIFLFKHRHQSRTEVLIILLSPDIGRVLRFTSSDSSRDISFWTEVKPRHKLGTEVLIVYLRWIDGKKLSKDNSFRKTKCGRLQTIEPQQSTCLARYHYPFCTLFQIALSPPDVFQQRSINEEAEMR
ncbi:hypothetical protein BgiMline_002204 [Biomphalaria glabrata]|nr:hypothetical protein BgiMline_002076 [Biomphalaria glabrata]